MKNKIRLIVKSCIFPLIMCIITLLIGIYLFRSTAIGIHLNEQLIILFIAFFPVFVFLLITVLFYHFRESHKKEFRIALKIITVVLSCLLIFYYFIALFACALLASGSPITDPKYYEHYVSGKRLEKAFPPEIPDNAENVNFYYAPGALQGGTNYSLYYIDNDMTKEKFDEMYQEKAVWIGYIEEYTEKPGLLIGAFSYTPARDENEDDYIIYLIEGRGDDSGYCNHGEFLIAAFNEKTNEVIFRSEQW